MNSDGLVTIQDGLKFKEFKKEGRKEMIYTVWPKDAKEMPQGFETRKEAEIYAENLECGYTIESTSGNCV